MIDKINNNHYDNDEWVDFEYDNHCDMVERDYKFLEMKFGTDETNSFFPILKFLDKNKIALGDTFKILEIEEFDGSVTISTRSGSIRISKQIATNLFLEIVDEK